MWRSSKDTGWFVGTFVFYWWHRLRHAKGWWLSFHQIHHSPSRIEVVTSFYKHPIEILCDAILSAVILYPVMGCSPLGAFWYNFFAGTGEYMWRGEGVRARKKMQKPGASGSVSVEYLMCWEAVDWTRC
jgi:sterol desaturase/sphingolipid hydroxylase (fatty acid hydroxylase superfamily)